MTKKNVKRASLDHMLAAALGSDSANARDLFSGFGKFAGMSEPIPSRRLPADDWLEQVEKIDSMMPDDLRNTLSMSSTTSKVERVYSTGEVQGTCYTDRKLFEVFVQCHGKIPPAGCSCDDSMGEFPCKHIDAFLQHLMHELEPGHSLYKRINSKQFTSGKPDRSRFKPDPDAQCLADLDFLLRRIPIAEKKREDELPPLSTKSVQRIAWSFTFHSGSFALTPMIQTQKKRGDGFTKGKKIALERLRTETGLTLTSADSAVIDAIAFAQDRYGYRSYWQLEPIEAISRLVGQPNVLLNDQPCIVRRRSFELSLMQHKGEWKFMLVDQNGEIRAGYVIGRDEHILAIDVDQSTIWYSPLPEDAFRLIRDLLQLPPIGEASLETLAKKAAPIQKNFALRLPERFAGPVVCQKTIPAVLLRSRADGSLDYGFRYRDAEGALRIPGAQPAITSTVSEGKPVQFHRDLIHEVEQAESLASDLGIDSSQMEDWHGSIHNFQQGLRFLESLQSNHQEIEVLWDKTSEKPIKVLGNLASKNVRVNITSKRNWFGITGECDFGNQTLTLDTLLQSLATSDKETMQGDYLRVADGQWARISETLRKQLTKLSEATHMERKSLTFDATAAPAIRDLMEGEVEVKATKNWHECLSRLALAEKLEPTIPAGLNAELRDYQIDGYKWMRRLAQWGVGGVLADDMGLGKTLQTLAVLLDRVAEGPALVIAPTSVGFNWVREAERFAPSLNVHLYRETDREEFLNSVGPGDLVICSYGLALRDESVISKVTWGTVVMDEAQAVKNSRSKTSQAIGNLDSKWTIALTGTPVENHLGELWSLFHLVSPGVLGGWEQFRKRYALPIEKHADDDARMSLANRLQPFVLRRTKSQVLTELPPRTETNLYVDLSPEERDQYNRIRASAIGEVDQLAALTDIKDQRFKLLALLTRLRQFACHPGIVNKQWTGSSAKLDHLCQTLTDLKEEGHRALVFSQFTEHLSLIRKAFDERGITYEYLDGSTPAAARQQRVDDFQNGTCDAFLISLKAGGTGLNLTAADYVIHMDPWWNPAVEDQATDRAHRIGQDKPVMVYRIIARGTIEEEILSLHDTKRDLVAGVLEGTTAAASFSTADLLAMIRGES